MDPEVVNRLKFHNGHFNAIDEKRISGFEAKAIIDRFYFGQNVDVTAIIEDLGPTVVLFSNVQPWSGELPDIDKKSARLFTIWAEDEKTKEVITIIQGFFILSPFKFHGEETFVDYYYFKENVPYYPIAIISGFLTVLNAELIDDLLERLIEEIQKYWGELRQRVIESVSKTNLWKRYVFSFEKIIHFSFVCPSFDRGLFEALRRKNYRVTNVLQLMASPTPSYDQAKVKTHIEEAKRTLEKAGFKKNKRTSDPL
ncbi:MAG: hypothetical protein ACFFD4_32825 [Candidatus Odinarchaeota archaeon]